MIIHSCDLDWKIHITEIAVLKDAANQMNSELKSVKAKLSSAFDINEGLHHKCDAQIEEQQALKTEAQKYRALVLTKLNDTQGQVDLLKKKLSCIMCGEKKWKRCLKILEICWGR